MLWSFVVYRTPTRVDQSPRGHLTKAICVAKECGVSVT